MSRPGLEGRRKRRSRGFGPLQRLVRDLVDREAPWLSAGLAAPKAASDITAALGRKLSSEARTIEERAHLDRALRDIVDEWSLIRPEDAFPLPALVTALRAPVPFWSPERLSDLRRARAVHRAFEDRIALLNLEQPAATVPAGLVLLSAMFDSACLSAPHLAEFARWLAVKGDIWHADGLPPWVDLKLRGSFGGGRSGAQLRSVSGRDATGPYALRRLFLATRTLDLIGRAGPGSVAALEGGNTGLLAGLLSALEPVPDPPRTLRALLSGATARLALEEDPPDQATLMLAARRLPTYAFTPESWIAAIGGATAVPASVKTDAPVPDLMDRRQAPRPAATAPRHEAMTGHGFVTLQAALHVAGTLRGNLTTEATKLTATVMAERLRRAPGAQDWPDCLLLLRDWYLDLLLRQKIAPHSVQRYHSTVGAALCAGAGDLPLAGLPAEDLEELYGAILEADIRSPRERLNLRHRLRRLHHFGAAAPAWDFPEIDTELFGGDGGGEGTVIRAVALSHRQVLAARNLIRSGMDLPPDQAAVADAAFLLASRSGLRIGEITKALLSHLEAPDPTGGIEPVLFVLPSKFGDNKTRSAYRQVRPLAQMNAREREEFTGWIARRRAMGKDGPLFGLADPSGAVVPLSRAALADLWTRALRAATGLDDPSAHSLRRHAINNLYLALSEHRAPDCRRDLLSDKVLCGFTGWTEAERRAIADGIVPPTAIRDSWTALARLAGHGNVETTFEAYLGLADLEIFRRATPSETTTDLHAALRRLQARIRTIAIPDQPVADLQDLPRWDRASPEVLLRALQHLDAGRSMEQAALMAQLDDEDLRQYTDAARQWAELRTRKGQPRLQPKGAEGRLAPCSPGRGRLRLGMDIAGRLVALAGSDAPGITGWIEETLSGATLTNAGVSFGDPETLRRWLGIALELRPANWWDMVLITPAQEPPGFRAWEGIRPAGMLYSTRRDPARKSLEVRMRLLSRPVLHASELAPVESSSGAIRFAAHLAAILLRVLPPAERCALGAG